MFKVECASNLRRLKKTGLHYLYIHMFSAAFAASAAALAAAAAADAAEAAAATAVSLIPAPLLTGRTRLPPSLCSRYPSSMLSGQDGPGGQDSKLSYVRTSSSEQIAASIASSWSYTCLRSSQRCVSVRFAAFRSRLSWSALLPSRP